ncbi:hypothetical protein FRB90_002014, partial [Tulasnella sp. 427]
MDEFVPVSPNPTDPGLIDLQIRSLSSLLRWVHQQGTKSNPPKEDDEFQEYLNHLALMFVSGRHSSDVAAVVPTFDNQSGYGLAAIQPYDLDVRKNLTKTDPLSLELDESRAKEELQDNEEALLIKHGHGALTRDVHVRHLEHLLNKIYLKPEENTMENRDHFLRYIHIYLFDKLKRDRELELGHVVQSQLTDASETDEEFEDPGEELEFDEPNRIAQWLNFLTQLIRLPNEMAKFLPRIRRSPQTEPKINVKSAT